MRLADPINLCNNAKMAGRPRRTPDPDLARSLREWQDTYGASCSDVAGQLDVAVSTITRSLESEAFSKDLHRKIRALLGGQDKSVDAAAAPVESWARDISKGDLRLLRKFVKLIPRAEQILSSALARGSGGEKP